MLARSKTVVGSVLVRRLAVLFAFIATQAVASAASATTIQVTYQLLFQAGAGLTTNATTGSRNVITNTPLNLGNASRAIGTPRTGAIAAGAPTDAFSPSTITIEFQGCGIVICDGPVNLVDVMINEQFQIGGGLAPTVLTDLIFSTPGGGTATGMLSGSTISWSTPETNWTTTGGVRCTNGLVGCSTGGLAVGWNPQDGTASMTLGNFVFGVGGPQSMAGFSSNFVLSNTSSALVTLFLETSELSRVVVPEPGTGLLVAMGLAVHAGRRRRS